jgi:hypothetical protein
VVLVKDPKARERLKMIEADLLEDESEKRKKETLFVTPGGTAPEPAAGLIDLPQGPEAPPEPERFDTAPYYRLDGTVKLRRSRFLHLDCRCVKESGNPNHSKSLPGTRLFLSGRALHYSWCTNCNKAGRLSRSGWSTLTDRS